MALEGLSISHLGTRFWATTSVDKLKTLVTDGGVNVDKAKKLKSIWAGSTRIGSLAQKGETGRFHDVFAAAKAFPKKLPLQNLSNARFLIGLLGGDPGEGVALTEAEAWDCPKFTDFARRITDIFAAKFPELVAKLPLQDEQDVLDFVGRVILTVNEGVDFAVAAQALDPGLSNSAVADYKTSLTNATLGALRMIAEKELSVDAIYTLGQKKVYDLSRRYDMYEVAWNAMHDANLIPQDDTRDGVKAFDVGDGSDKTLKSRLAGLKAILAQQVNAPNGLEEGALKVARKTLAAINYCLHLGSRERRLDKFAAKAHAVLDPLVKSAGERNVSFTGALTFKGGMDVGISKLTIEGKAKVGRDMTLSCGPDGIAVTTLTGGGLEGSANFGFLDVPGAKTNLGEIPDKGSKAFGVHAKVGAGFNFRVGRTTVYRTTDDFITAMKGKSELVESNRFFGFLRSIGRLLCRAGRRLFGSDGKAYEIDQREFLATVRDAARENSPLAKLDGFLSRQKVAVIASRRDFKRIDGGAEIEGGVNFGISKGMDDDSEENGQATFSDNRLVDASASFKLLGSRDLKVASRSYQTVSERYRSQPGSSTEFREWFHDECADLAVGNPPIVFGAPVGAGMGTDVRRRHISAILDYIEGTLVGAMKEVEAAFSASKGDAAARTAFVRNWNRIAVQYELLRRRVDEILALPLEQDEGGFPNDIMGQFDRVCLYMASRLDRPDVPSVAGMDIFNEEIANTENSNSFKTTKVSVTLSGGVGPGLGGWAKDTMVDNKVIPDGFVGYVEGQAVEKGVNTAVQGASDILPTNLSLAFDFEWKTPIINVPKVPWENVAQKKTTVTFSPWCGIRFFINKYVEAQVKAGNVGGDIRGKTDSGTAGDRVRNELLNFLGVALQDSILDQPLNMLLKEADLSSKLQLANFVKCAMTGCLTLTSVNGKIVSITSAKTQSSSSGIGVDFKLGAVSINASVSKTVSETKPAYTLVGAMPIDVVLGRLDGHALVTRHQQLLNYLAGNPAEAMALAGAIAHPANDQTDEAIRHDQAARILASVRDKSAGLQKAAAEQLLAQLDDAKARLAECLAGDAGGQQRTLDALATYLEILRDAFAFGVSARVVYTNV